MMLRLNDLKICACSPDWQVEVVEDQSWVFPKRIGVDIINNELRLSYSRFFDGTCILYISIPKS